MKGLLYILLLCVLFVSCESDEMEEISSDKIVQMEQTSYLGYGGAAEPQTLVFTYDEQGRLRTVNDKVFYYGEDHKVAYSRVASEYAQPQGKVVYVERLSYHWDERGRLQEVYLDSLYTKTPVTPGGIAIGDSENLTENILLASYRYEGVKRKPSTIVYRAVKRSGTNIIAIGKEERIDYNYDGENVTSSVLTGTMEAAIASEPKGGTSYQLVTVNSYLPNMHPLAKLYNQLGFHPDNLTEVVPLNCVSTAFREVEIESAGGKDVAPSEESGMHWHDYNFGQEEKPISDVLNTWDGKTTYSYRFNALELPTEIVGEGENGAREHMTIRYE